MPNVTITVSEELKTEMDKYSEVSWSEICRNAIASYIAQRVAPAPKIELDVRNSMLDNYDYETGYPTLIVDLRIQNRMNTEVTVDRILATVRTEAQDGRRVIFGQAYDLRRRTIGPNSVGLATIRLAFPREKLLEFQNKFTQTFVCTIDCAAFVDCFTDAYRQEIPVQIPIDVWKRVMDKALGTNQATQ